MKNYTIDAYNEVEKEEIDKRINRIGLKEKLQILHEQTNKGTCPLEVHYIVKDGNHMVSKKYKELGIIREGLIILIDEEKPNILANDCRGCHLDVANKYASIVFNDVLVLIYFKQGILKIKNPAIVWA